MILAVLFSLAIAGQSPEIPRQCRDDNGADRCAADQQAAVRAKLGVAAIEDEAAADVETYRAFYVDGYGRDMPVVSFERRPGSDPMVVVSGSDGRRMSSPVSSEAWDRVRVGGRFADRALGPAPASASSDDFAICLHAWVTTVEMANSTPDERRGGPVRRRTENACGSELTTQFTFALAEEAVKAIAPCGLLDETVQRNSVTILQTCLGLSGDRFAAAGLMNQIGNGMPRRGPDSADAGSWRAYLGTNGSPEVRWAGERVKTERGRDSRAAEFIVAQIQAHPSLRVWPKRFEGRDSRAATVEGVVAYSTGEDAAEQRYEAPYSQTWVWDPSLVEWMLETWTVGAFVTVAR